MKRNGKITLGLVLVFTLVLTFSFMPKTFADETVTNAQILDMCDRVASFITVNGSVPNYVSTVSGGDIIVSTADFHYMIARWLRYYKNNSAAPATVAITRGITGPPTPSGTESGTIQQVDILAKGQSNADFIDTNDYLPNFSTVGSTQYTTKAMFSVFARTINWYQDNGSLPSYATVSAIDAPSTWTYGDTATPTPTNQPTPPPAYPWSKTISMSWYGQPDGYTCGPTSLSMVMDYFGAYYSANTIGNWMASWGDSPWYDGVGESAIIAAAKHYGYSNAHTSSGLTNLKTCIQNNNPVILHFWCQGGSYPRYYPSNNPAYQGSTGHYVVCCGLKADANGNVLYYVIHDPARYAYTQYTASSVNSAWGYMSYRYINTQ